MEGLSLASVFGRSHSIVPGDKVVGDGEEVLSKLLLGVWVLVLFLRAVTENHEFCPRLCNDPVNQLEGKAAEAVSVGNHNLADLSVMAGVQKGAEAGTVPVDP